MRPEDIRRWLQLEPFQRFRVHLTNGISFEVRHPEQATVGRSTVIITVPPSIPRGFPEERHITVALLPITHLEPVGPPVPPSIN